MAKLSGTKTHDNLKEAFAGESQANRRYLYFAQKADVEGYNDVAAVFRSTAEGETGHAHGHLEFMEAVGDPATGLKIGPTGDNLKAAIAGETHEYTDMYPGMAKTARQEGFDEIADWFETLGQGREEPCRPVPEGARHAGLSHIRLGARASRPLFEERCGRRRPRDPGDVRVLTFSGSFHVTRRQSRSADPASDRLAGSRFHRSGQARRGDAPGLRHLSRLPALLQSVRFVSAAVRSRRCVADDEVEGVKSEDFAPVVEACTLCDMCFMTKCPYVPPHRVQSRFPASDAALPRGGGAKRARRTSSRASWPRWTATARLATRRRAGRQLGLGHGQQAHAQDRWRGRRASMRAPNCRNSTRAPSCMADRGDPASSTSTAPAFGKRKALLFATCFVNYNRPPTGMAARKLLNHLGVETQVGYPGCCGMPFLEQAELARVAEQADKVSKALLPYDRSGLRHRRADGELRA